MDELNFKINQKLEILDNNIAYKCNIQDIRDDSILINMPYSGIKYYSMHTGSTLEFFICTERDVVKCKSIVVGRTSENNIHMAVLSKPVVIERVQRREYFRLPISMEAKYIILPEDNTYIDLQDVPSGYLKRMKKTLTVDLSGGGVKIISKHNPKKGQKIVLSIHIPEELTIIGTVMRTEYSQINRHYRIALKFESIEEKLRDKIIRFIFSKFREQSKLLR
ncbi:c-di-GMP-binding flagellar brake protein YcgR [Fonticella tunisiensis]|uniref:C-di-GMP-binding flagellar brake protein YcgR n=1 Tax=Fonticella tunisiensis TaxID=1096341 RepID=A0A4R7K996_9CLOT|nr:c-di-GMP-binding flagellar brake protein YcgR [Fonticella tunisiensis]